MACIFTKKTVMDMIRTPFTNLSSMYKDDKDHEYMINITKKALGSETSVFYIERTDPLFLCAYNTDTKAFSCLKDGLIIPEAEEYSVLRSYKEVSKDLEQRLLSFMATIFFNVKGEPNMEEFDEIGDCEKALFRAELGCQTVRFLATNPNKGLFDFLSDPKMFDPHLGCFVYGASDLFFQDMIPYETLVEFEFSKDKKKFLQTKMQQWAFFNDGAIPKALFQMRETFCKSKRVWEKASEQEKQRYLEILKNVEPNKNVVTLQTKGYDTQLYSSAEIFLDRLLPKKVLPMLFSSQKPQDPYPFEEIKNIWQGSKLLYTA